MLGVVYNTTVDHSNTYNVKKKKHIPHIEVWVSRKFVEVAKLNVENITK